MSDTFLNSVETENGEYTNMVTADDLNNIARDLGIPDYSYFPEEPPESAVSALNQITKDLTSKGVLHIGNECKVSISGGAIYVADGVCVFDTGAKKRISETDMVSVDFLPGATNYVYLLHNEADNKIQLISSHAEPDAGNFVMLAEIDEEHKVTDRRYWSLSKTGNGVNNVLEFTEKLAFYDDKEMLYEYDISSVGGNYFISQSTDYTKTYPVAIKLIEGEAKSFNTQGFGVLKIKKEGSKLYISTDWWGTSSYGTEIVTFWIV